MQQKIDELEARLAEAMVRDRHRLRQQLRRARERQRGGQPADRSLARVREALERSVQMARARRDRLPRITYDDTLPIVAAREEIAAAIRDHQVTIICGATGSGKSTQLPKLCLELGRGVHGLIGHTQPRRLAARSLAARVADELGSSVGQHVGYKVRFNDTTSPEAYIKLMTDGILLAETQSDRFLDAYDTLIIDEAHERSLNIDFLLGYLRELQPRRPDLKIIITSATIDPQRFAEHFASASTTSVSKAADEQLPGGESAGSRRPPVLEVSGRTYPVEVRYRPLTTEEIEVEDRDMVDGIADAIDELMRTDPGDVLVFLPTERDIRETAKSLRKRLPTGGAQAGLEVLPLYARLSSAEQNRIFKPHGGRRIVLATNVAETSLTVPGIRHVIDTGVARISRFSARAGVQRLPIEPVSQASADQRKGRCGRTAPGICIRLYSEEDYLAREPFTPPEVLRTNLAAVILQMMAMGMGRVEAFPFIDPPKPAMIRAGYRTLHELGAIDEQERLTPVGRTLARLPVDPRLGRMILAGEKENCLAEVLIVAAALEVQEPRLRPPDQQQRADEAHARFADEQSDFQSYLKLWDFYHDLKRKLSHSRLRLACQENYLSHNRMREWVDVHRQLRDLAREAGLKLRDRREDYDALHRALLSGLLSHVAVLSKGFEYAGTGGKKLYLWPGSGLFKKKPKWIMAAELIETSQLFARTAARINPDWIEPLAGDLLSRSYSEPHWQPKQGHVGAFEKVSLMGLTIVPRRQVHYGPIDPVRAREMFIYHALVEGDCHLNAPFFRHNQTLIAEVEQLEAKARRRDLLADEQARFAFHDARVPADVTNLPQFERWRKQAERDNPKLLFMSERDLLAGDAGDITADVYPDRLQISGAELPLQYQLKPGEADDGVTLAAPLEVLNQLDERQLDWAVPGLLREKVLALIRSLPKSLRRNFVPAPDYTDEVLKVIRFGEGSLMDAVADALGRLTGVNVPVSAFKPETLPPHLHVNVRALDEQGKTLAEGRDLSALRQELGAEATQRFAGMGDDSLTRTGLTNWDFDELPKQVEVARAGGMTMTGHPALIDEGDSVAIRVLDTPERARHETRLALRRLFYLQVKPEVTYRVEHLPDLEKMRLHAATLMDIKTLKRHIAELIVDRAFLGDSPRIRTRADFDAQLDAGWNRLGSVTQQVAQQLAQLFAHYHHVTLLLEQAANPQWQHAVADVREQLGLLVSDGFLTRTPWQWLASYPRYLAAITARLQKLAHGGLQRDRTLQATVAPYWQHYRQAATEHERRGVFDPELEHFRWMLEEYRVSLFAQELGTAISVSPQRLQKQWQKVRA